MIILFSKDRAFQLEACLRTLEAQCEDLADVPVYVLWTTSSPSHRQAYEILRETYEAKPTVRVHFIQESIFRRDLLLVLGNLGGGSWRPRMARWILGGVDVSSNRQSRETLIAPLLRPEAAALFVVDDTLFLKPFRFAESSRILLANNDALAFSLRLGQGLTYFYMGNCSQEVPAMTPANAERTIYHFRWTDAKGDFGYPLEISSSILKLKLILPRLMRKKWRSPNTLEMALANMAGRYRKKYPMLLTFAQPRAVSVPLNIVQQDFADNRHGGQERNHPDALCELFLRGLRADLSPLDRINPTSVHVEIDLVPAAS
jgi:hypothetical protein